jgi:signal peptidase I
MNQPDSTGQTVAAPPPPALEQAKGSFATTVCWMRDLLLSMLIAVVVILFLYQPVKVEGTSMEPALVDQERIFINKFVYRFGLSDIKRGDTVVFWAPFDPAKSYIKRVIGTPGDIVEIVRGTVYVNGKALQEDYVPPEYRDRITKGPVSIGRGEYFVLGDHRVSSNDSRFWGVVARNDIYGKAVFVYWPLNRVGVIH